MKTLTGTYNGAIAPGDTASAVNLGTWTAGKGKFTVKTVIDPDANELALAKSHLEKPRKAADGQPLDAMKSKRQGYEDILWAMLNTKEFLFNH